MGSSTVWPGSCAAVSVRGLTIRDSIDDRSQHTFSHMVCSGSHPLSWLLMSAEASRVTTLYCPRLNKVRRWEGSSHLCLLHLVTTPPLFEIYVPPPGRLQYTSGALDDYLIPMGFPGMLSRGIPSVRTYVTARYSRLSNNSQAYL